GRIGPGSRTSVFLARADPIQDRSRRLAPLLPAADARAAEAAAQALRAERQPLVRRRKPAVVRARAENSARGMRQADAGEAGRAAAAAAIANSRCRWPGRPSREAAAGRRRWSRWAR